MQNGTLRRLVGMALLGAVSYVVMLFEFPIIPIAAWMKLDLADIPVLIGLVLYGVSGALVITIIKLVLHSATMGFALPDLIGSVASFLGTATLILIIAAVMHYYHGPAKWRMPLAILLATIGLTVVEATANVTFVLPFYLKVMGFKLGLPLNQLLLVAIIPFNLIKGVIVGSVFWAVYARLAKALGGRNQLLSRGN